MQLLVRTTRSCPRGVTLVIELEQRIESVAQVDRRANGSCCSLSNAWRLRKSEARKQVAEEEESFGGRPYRDVDVEERAEARDFHKPQAMMTAIETPMVTLPRRHLDAKNDQSI